MDFSCGYDCSEIRASTVYETLRALKAKENESQYATFLHGGNFYSLMQSYQAFDPESSDPGQVRYLTAGFLFQVVDFYGEEREVAIVAMNYLDRFLMSRFSQNEKNVIINPRSLRYDITNVGQVRTPGKILDVYALACLGIAIKLFSPLSGCPLRARKYRSIECRQNGGVSNFAAYYNGIKNHSLVEVGGGLISAIDISNIELVILETLSYRLHPPTSYAFITNILRLVPFDPESISMLDDIFEFAKYQAELASLNAEALKYPPSLIAAAALCNAIHHHLSLVLSANKVRTLNLSNLLDYDTSKNLRLLVSRMEYALQLSLELDTRIVSLRHLLSYLMDGGGKKRLDRNGYDDENFQPVSTTTMNDRKEKLQNNKTNSETKPMNQAGKSSSKKRNSSDSSSAFDSWGPWETADCFLTLALDALLPDTCPNSTSVAAKNEKWISEKTNQMNCDLIEHYNRYIKPKLYKQQHTSTSLSIDTSGVAPLSVQSGTLSTVPSERCSF